MPKRRFWNIFISIFIFCLCAGGVVFYVGLITATPAASEQSEKKIISEEIPELRLYLNDTNLETINSNGKDVKYSGNMARFVVDEENYDFENVEIKGRGNSTWWNAEKKPYQIKFDSKKNLFGLGKAKTWILLANYFDGSYIRNDMAFYIANLLDMDYANSGEFVELYMDDEYVGLYYLTQKVGVSNASARLRDKNGVLMELDNIYAWEESQNFSAKNGDTFVLKDSVSDDEIDREIGAVNFIESYNQLQEAVWNKDWKKIEELIDVDSFVKYYILQIFTLNWDAFTTSNFFYKDGFDDKIHAGPAWDYDNTLGQWLETAFYRRSLQYNGLESKVQSYLFFELFEMPEFKEKVTKIVNNELLPNSESIMSHAKNTMENISIAAIRDSEKWQRYNFYDEIQKLLSCIEKRLEYFQIYYGNTEELANGDYLIKELNENFYFEQLDDKSYKITRKTDGKTLSLSTGYTEYGETEFKDFENTIFEKWYISRDDEGKYYLFSKATESVLFIEDGILKTEPLQQREEEKFEIAEIGIFPLDTF